MSGTRSTWATFSCLCYTFCISRSIFQLGLGSMERSWLKTGWVECGIHRLGRKMWNMIWRANTRHLAAYQSERHWIAQVWLMLFPNQQDWVDKSDKFLYRISYSLSSLDITSQNDLLPQDPSLQALNSQHKYLSLTLTYWESLHYATMFPFETSSRTLLCTVWY